MARKKVRKSPIRTRVPLKRPTSLRDYSALSASNQETWNSILHVVTSVGNGRSLTKASRDFGVPRDLVIELARPALRKWNGRYVTTGTDSLVRVVNILTAKGKKIIATQDSRQASIVGSHWAAVQKYLQTGDDSALLKFKKTRVLDASGKRHRLLTDLEELNRLASAGVLSFESMYAGGLQ